MTKAQNAIKNSPKVATRTTSNMPELKDAEIGELFYNVTSNRLYIRTITGWKYVAFS